jgi:RNA-binding protein NOB1
MYKLIVFVFNLQSIAENIYTIPEVVKEIKDKATLQRLQVLPYKIEYRELTKITI